MKKLTILFALVLICAFANAQTADEIIQKHIEKTGGIKAWEAIKSIKIISEIAQAGQLTTNEKIETKEGCFYQASKTKESGFEFVEVDIAFDGRTAWGTNYQTGMTEKKTKQDIENLKCDLKKFPSAYINYKAKGFTIELLGEESIDGVDCYKLKIITGKKHIEKEKVDDVLISFISKKKYFEIALDKNFYDNGMSVPIRLKYSNFKKISGIILPYSIIYNVMGISVSEKVSQYEINSKIDKSIFKFKQ
jgi:hypothetical protein